MRKIREIILLLIVFALASACSKDGKLPPQRPGDEKDGPFVEFASLLTETEAQRLETLDKTYDPSICLLKGGTYLSTLEYVVLLFKSGSVESLERGELILKTIINAQVTDVGSNQYGNWPWGINRAVGDRNPPVFFARRMLGELWPMKDRMRPGMVKAFDRSCALLVHAAEHRWDVEKFARNRDGVRYTNVFVMYVETLVLAGERFEDTRLKELAVSEWKRFYEHFKSYGLDEFLSRDYDDITFRSLWSIHSNIKESLRDEVKEALDLLYVTKSAVIHPVLNTHVVGISRDDRKFVAGNDTRSEFLKPGKLPAGYEVPEEDAALKSRTYPFEINGRAGDYTFTYKSYMAEAVNDVYAAMGSMTGWGCYYSQNVHLMASVGVSTNAKATLFIPGSYIFANGFADQKELTGLCVYNRLRTMWHCDQWGGGNMTGTFFDFGVGLSTQWKEVSSEAGKIVLDPSGRGYNAWLYPFVIDLKDNTVKPCSLRKVQRTKSSEKYHVADLKFDELVFPSDAQWFGVYVKLVKKNENPAEPVISFEKTPDGHMRFTTNEGHKIEIEEKDRAYVQVRDVDPLTLPLYAFGTKDFD